MEERPFVIEELSEAEEVAGALTTSLSSGCCRSRPPEEDPDE